VDLRMTNHENESVLILRAALLAREAHFHATIPLTTFPSTSVSR